MKKKSEYDIHIAALKEGHHTFSYIINDEFLAQFNYEGGGQNPSVEAELQLNKSHNFLDISIAFYGSLQVECDRCSGAFPLKIWDEYKIFVKYAQDADACNQNEKDPCVYYLPMDAAFLNVEQWLYDFYLLCIPLVKQCDDENFRKKTYCDEEALKRIQNL